MAITECRHCFGVDHKYVCNCGHHHTNHVDFFGCKLCSFCSGYSQTRKVEEEITSDKVEG